MRRGLDAAVGAVLVIVLVGMLLAGLRWSASAEDLRVTVRAPQPYEIAPRSGAPLAPVRVGPPSLLPRLEQVGLPDRTDPGLWLRTWQVTYGHRWERQITVPVLAGPFDPEGKPWPCSMAVRLSPAFFDDGKPGGEDVASVVERVVRAQFPFSVMGLRFAPVSTTSLRVRLVEGGLAVTGAIVLADARRDPTDFAIDAKIAIGERDGDLTAKVEHVRVGWRGHTRRDPLVELASIFVDVDEQARRIVSAKLAAALAIVRLPKDPISIFPDRPADRFTLRLCDAPDVRPEGFTLRLRVVASLAEPRVDPSIAGPPHLEDRPVLPPAAEGAPTFEASLSAAAVQQGLYAMWQAGELSAWGREPRVIAALQRKMSDRLAFDLGAVDPRLVPVVLPDGDPSMLRVRFGAVELGRVGERRVLAHGDVIARASFGSGGLGLAGTIADLRVSCVAGGPGEWTMSPCFSDVVPALRDSGMTSEGLPLDLEGPRPPDAPQPRAGDGASAARARRRDRWVAAAAPSARRRAAREAEHARSVGRAVPVSGRCVLAVEWVK
ncbi:MAG: hypothetical protein QM820_25045 [Minicystis sp.]